MLDIQILRDNKSAEKDSSTRAFDRVFMYSGYLICMIAAFIKPVWSLLFIMPGIIKSCSYAMVPFILADDPSLGAREAITLSRKMMDGNKWRLFVLDLSFFGWMFLSACTFGILDIFYVNPYMHSTHAELYNVLKIKVAE